MDGGLTECGSAPADGAAEKAEVRTSDEAFLWRVHADRARKAFSFWSQLLGLRMGPRHDQFLDAAAEARFGSIIRAMSWVESKHGTAGANQPARDPMQCGNPGDIWWRELTGQTERQDRFTRGPGLSDLWAGALAPVAEADPAFPANARLSALRNPARGHKASDFGADHSFFWSIPYFVHRTNIPASGRTFRCGSASLIRLIEGAVAYNGGGDPRYRDKIRDALEVIGILPVEARATAMERSDPEATPADVDRAGAALSAILRDVVQNLADSTSPDEAGQLPPFARNVRGLHAKVTVTTATTEVVSAEVRIDAHTEASDIGVAESLPDPCDTDEGPHDCGDHHEEGDGEPWPGIMALAADREPSGVDWVARFPGSRATSDLHLDFRNAVEGFLGALAAGGATVRINATYRPPERAFLMHHAWRIARQAANPGTIPRMEGVNIEWVHRDASGLVDLQASRRAAEVMVQAYGMRVRAALRSRHTERRAIDMSISWAGTLAIRDAAGHAVQVTSAPRTGDNPRLHQVGRTFGCVKLVSDPPHWSDDGR